MKNIILSQKLERDNLRQRVYLPRDGLESARAAMQEGLIKVVIGPRRAGKSVFAMQILEQSEYAYINFDDDRLAGVANFDELLMAIAQVYGDVRTFFLMKFRIFPAGSFLSAVCSGRGTICFSPVQMPIC